MRHNLRWDFDIQTDHLDKTTRLYNNQRKNRTWKIVNFAVPVDHRVKLIESENNDKYFNHARELKKTVEHESDVYTNCNWCSWCTHRRIKKGAGGLGNEGMRGDPPNYYIIEISENTEKSPGDLGRLDVTQTPVKDHQLTLM